MGNHDKRPRKEYLGYFAEVYDYPLYISNRVVLSHYPIPVTEGTLNVHGHLHGSTLDSSNHFNISIHMVDYRPVHMNIINSMAGGLNKDNTRFLEEWYADQYLFTTDRKDIVTDEYGKIILDKSFELRKNLYPAAEKETK